MSMKSLSLVAAAALALCAGAAQANVFANGGFEIEGKNPPPAESWLTAAAGYSRSSDAFAGSWSASLSLPNGFGAAIALQNSVKDGLQPALTAGDELTFSFWTKGSVSPTGNVLYALRFLNDNGDILYSSGNQFFQGVLSSSQWKQVSFVPAPVPVGATAAFVEFSAASGPLCDPAPTNCGIQNVLIDSVNLAPVPEPSTYALMLAGLAGVGVLAKRRRQA